MDSDNMVSSKTEPDTSTATSTTPGRGLGGVRRSSGAYKATKLWLDVLETFRKGVPLGKRRALLRQYDSCFVANSTVTWFHAELQKKFDAGITRRQTIHLLQKFYKAGVFTAVTNHSLTKTVSANENKTKETDFKDNRRLYKLVDHDVTDEVNSDNLITTTNRIQGNGTTTIQKTTDYYVVINQLSSDDINEIWKNVFVERFVQVVGYNVFTTFLKPGSVQGQRVKYNMTNISSNGIVIVSPVEDLPSWITNAMQCITRGLVDVDFKHSNYPGFENDVFGLIRDYFRVAFKDKAPLLTFDLYDAFVTTFVRAAVFNGGQDQAPLPVPVNHLFYENESRRSFPEERRFRFQEKYPFSVSDSTEDLLLDMLTPSPKKTGRSRLETIPSPEETESDFIGIQPMPVQSYEITKYKRVPERKRIFGGTDPVYFETAFTSEKSPITRVISKAEIECSLGALPRLSKLNLDEKDSKSNVASVAYENPMLTMSPGDLVNHPKYSKLLDSITSGVKLPGFSKKPFPTFLEVPETIFGPSEPEVTRSLDPSFLLQSSGTGPHPLPGPGVSVPSQRKPYRRSHSAVNLSDVNRDRSGSYAPLPLINHHGNQSGENDGFRQLLLKQFANSPCRSAQKTVKMFSGEKTNSKYVLDPKGKEFAIVSFRLLTLLLPPSNRRSLFLLLQFMSKIVDNKKFVLDVANPTRCIVLNEFSRAIVGCSVEQEYDQYLATQIVSFLMDYFQEVFDVSAEASLKITAENQISEQQIVKVAMDVPQEIGRDDENFDKENQKNGSKFSCNQVTLDEYEDQRLLGGTAQSLRELLSACDALPDIKERKRQLKKFRKEYPHIYAEKYGDIEATSGIESSNEVEKDGGHGGGIPPKLEKRRIFRALF